MKSRVSPSFYGFPEAFLIAIRYAHGYGTLVPGLRTIGAKIEQVILRFRVSHAYRVDGGPDKSSFCEIVPGEDTFMCDKP
jgi:hypothetical protein